MFDVRIDYAYLRVVVGTPKQKFLSITPMESHITGMLICYGIGNSQEIGQFPSIVTHIIHISRILPPFEFQYDAQTMDGDSGGAIVVGSSGKVIGMHLAHVNRSIKLAETKEIKHADEVFEVLNTKNEILDVEDKEKLISKKM
jgi:hypothetical protein